MTTLRAFVFYEPARNRVRLRDSLFVLDALLAPFLWREIFITRLQQKVVKRLTPSRARPRNGKATCSLCRSSDSAMSCGSVPEAALSQMPQRSRKNSGV